MIFQLVTENVFPLFGDVDVAVVGRFVEGKPVARVYKRLHIKGAPLLPVFKVYKRIQHAGV